VARDAEVVDKRVRELSKRTKRQRKDEDRERAWTRETFLSDLDKVSRRATAEIEADPKQAKALDRAREQARAGNLISQEELDRRLNDDE
jgi:hypothetical protein